MLQKNVLTLWYSLILANPLPALAQLPERGPAPSPPAWTHRKVPSSSTNMKENLDQTKKNTVEFVDVQKLDKDNPKLAVKKTSLNKPSRVIDVDVLIVGGGLGGVAAALQAADVPSGKGKSLSVALTEECDWLGGQATSQGVSALDENYMVETSGACRVYQDLRQAIRSHYQKSYNLSAAGLAQEYFNPGNCWVTYLAFEPKVFVDLVDTMLAPLVDNGSLAIYKRLKPVYAHVKGTKKVGDPRIIESVYMIDLDSGELLEFRAKICLDATENGDLLPLAGIDFRSGSDSHSVTGEPHAPERGNSSNIQDFTYPFVVEFRPGEKHVLSKPAMYDEFKKQGYFSLFGYKMFEPSEIESESGKKRKVDPFWTYRRLIDKDQFEDDKITTDIAMINWMANDLRGKQILEVPVNTQAEHLAQGKLLSLGFLHWLQTEAPRDDGGVGYPELLLRTDILDTADGVSKYPYIRESRRLVAKKMIVEQDIAETSNPHARSHLFDDSVGIGLYPVDIHGEQEIPGTGQSTKPFQLPLGALIPKQDSNLLAACKNIGVTHITNGSYRLHPIEWAIGTASGAFARLLLEENKDAGKAYDSPDLIRKLQHRLISAGAPVFWFKDVPTDHPNFKAIQTLAIKGIMNGSPDSLDFRPREMVTAYEAAQALCNSALTGKHDVDEVSKFIFEACAANSGQKPNEVPATFESLDRTLRQFGRAKFPFDSKSACTGVSRQEFAQWLYDHEK